MKSSTEIDAWPLAARISGAIGSGPNIWQVIVDTQSENRVADTLLAELESLYDGPIRCETIESVNGWLKAIAANREDVLVLSLDSPWNQDEWRQIDTHRSRLMRNGMTILIAGQGEVAAMATAAPNLWSWVGGQVWALRSEEDTVD